MKFSTFVATAAFATSTVVVSTAAFADVTPTDFTGSNVSMGLVHAGQYGTITNLYQNLFSIPPNVVGGGSIFGFLPSNLNITFTYTFAPGTGGTVGLVDGNLQANQYYNYNQSGNNFQGFSSADSTLGTVNSKGFTNGVASAPLVFSSANLTVNNPGTSTGTVSFTNKASSFSSFESIFTGLLRLNPRAIGSATYAVSSIPLPAALPMFATLLAGMFGFARSRKRKALAA